MNEALRDPVEAPRDERGFTFVELIIVTTIIAILSVMITQSIRGLASTQVYTRSQSEVISVGERLLQDIARDCRYAMRVFEESAEDRNFLRYVDFPFRDVAAGSRFPIGTSSGTFIPDLPLATTTGNILAIAVTQPSVTVDLGTSRAAQDQYRIDVFRFVAYHLKERRDSRLDLARWSSRPVARYADIVAIEDYERRSRCLTQLAAEGIEVAWHTRALAASAFHQISGETGTMMPYVGELSTGAAPPVLTDEVMSAGELLARRGLEIAENGGTRVPVPMFAVPVENFPHGFEVKIDGPGSGRLLLVRVVIAKRRANQITNMTAVKRLMGLRDS